ncbi:hypothetical protein CE91St65_11820 [[Clostridium] symbiosum]|nr:hypothetical protein CE91St65_11820 [[Clostridium] symbiosum]BDF28205.1 hypothetical protein CE91St66_11820 [[Clostridium] symbiosum]
MLSLEGAVQPDSILSGSALRKQSYSISFSCQQCHFPRDERLINPPHHPVRWPSRQRPHLLNYKESD